MAKTTFKEETSRPLIFSIAPCGSQNIRISAQYHQDVIVSLLCTESELKSDDVINQFMQDVQTGIRNHQGIRLDLDWIKHAFEEKLRDNLTP